MDTLEKIPEKDSEVPRAWVRSLDMVAKAATGLAERTQADLEFTWLFPRGESIHQVRHSVL